LSAPTERYARVHLTRDVFEHAGGVRTALLAHSKTFLLTETVTVPLT